MILIDSESCKKVVSSEMYFTNENNTVPSIKLQQHYDKYLDMLKEKQYNVRRQLQSFAENPQILREVSELCKNSYPILILAKYVESIEVKRTLLTKEIDIDFRNFKKSLLPSDDCLEDLDSKANQNSRILASIQNNYKTVKRAIQSINIDEDKSSEHVKF